MRGKFAERVIPAGLKDGEQVLDEPAAMLVIELRHPPVDRARQIPGARGQAAGVHELATLDLPVQREMLHDAGAVAGDDRIAVLHMLAHLEQHADDRRFRHRLVDERRDPRITGSIEEVGVEARPVMAEHGDKALLHRGRRVCGRIHRQIAAFGMAADHERAVPAPRDVGQIPRGGLLRGDRTTERHREILLPADDRAVGAAERDVR